MTAKSLSQIHPDLKSKMIEEVKPKLIEATIERKELLRNMTDDVFQYYHRWRVVKATKAMKALEGGGYDLDNFSDADSVSSYSSKSGSSTSGYVE